MYSALADTCMYSIAKENTKIKQLKTKKSERMDLQIFSNSEFGEIRTATIDGEPWFVGKDIAKTLCTSRRN